MVKLVSHYTASAPRCNRKSLFFDFHDDVLWVLLPKTVQGRTIEGKYVFIIKRDALITILLAQVNSLDTLLKDCADLIANGELQKKEKMIAYPKNFQDRKATFNLHQQTRRRL